MKEVNGKIAYLGSEDLMPQFKECDINNVSFAKMKMDTMRKMKNCYVAIFIDDREDMDSHGDKILMKSEYYYHNV